MYNSVVGDDCSMVLKKALGLNAAISQQWAELLKYKDPNSRVLLRGKGKLVVNTPTRLWFSNSSLTVTVECNAVDVGSLSQMFAGVVNVFRDEVPSEVWFDLSSALAKYDDLKASEKTLVAIESWKTALEKVHLHLGQCHEKVLDLDRLQARVKELFQLTEISANPGNSAVETQRYDFSLRSEYREFGSFVLSFELLLKAGKEKELQNAATAVLTYYEPLQNRNGKGRR